MSSRRLFAFCGLLFCLGFLLPVSSRADGGTIRFQGDTKSFHVTVFTAPPVISAGTVDITVLVQDRPKLQPLLDATVTFDLSAESRATTRTAAWTPPACVLSSQSSLTAIPAKLSHGEDRLLYGAYVQVPYSGIWELRITIQRGPQTEYVSTVLPVNPPTPPALAYWHLFMLPPLGILGFVLNRSAKERRALGSRLNT
ncbi:MAG TPA: hypothetical protein VE860_19800 [Chthoniobacterales bacterium]|jgi:hypothetical protein|nr:hypothetical protein [Chthoniobacterales bacterium]